MAWHHHTPATYTVAACIIQTIKLTLHQFNVSFSTSVCTQLCLWFRTKNLGPRRRCDSTIKPSEMEREKRAKPIRNCWLFCWSPTSWLCSMCCSSSCSKWLISKSRWFKFSYRFWRVDIFSTQFFFTLLNLANKNKKIG